MTEVEKYKITNNDYMDLIIQYSNNPAFLEPYREYTPHMMNTNYAIIYVPTSKISQRLVVDYGYSAIPHCYSINSQQSLEASGINKLRRTPTINLQGEGIIIGIIDTGIDYTHPVFQHEDGTSKIIGIWDQSIDSENQYPNLLYPPYFGTEYTSEQINQALQSENPLQVVPSIDEHGHGTMLAGIAAGIENQENKFSGVAPAAELMIVKLKQAKTAVKEFFFIPNVDCYQETDIMWAVQYLVERSRQFRKPISICIGLGTSQGAHDATGALNSLVSMVADFPGVSIAVAAGNEGNLRRHFYSETNPSATPVPVELNVGENESGFSVEFWGDPPTIYTLDILSPSGEYTPRIIPSLVENREISFFFENTIIIVDYVMVEEETGKQVILLRFQNPTKGVWKFQIYGSGDLSGAFHMWLPSADFVSESTYFLMSNPNITVTSPGNNIVPMTITAYNSDNDTLYLSSGKGYSTSNIINPCLAAPGVNIQCPALNHNFTAITGTGAATAHAAGIAAMLLEWSIVDGNYPGIDTVGIKKFLIRGAKRSNQYNYPNQDWGYGIIDIYNSFNILRTDIMK